MRSRNARQGKGFGPKNRNRTVVARFRARRVKRQQGMVGKGGGVMQWWCWLWCARPIGSTRGGKGVWDQSHKSERDGSVSGAPLEMAVVSDRVRWRGGVDEVAAAGWSCVRQREAGEGFGAKNPKLGRHCSVSGWIRAVSSGEGLCGVTAPPPAVT